MRRLWRRCRALNWWLYLPIGRIAWPKWPTDSVCKRYTDSREFLANPDVQAVSIATHYYDHAEVASDALRAGKHVLFEKPRAEPACSTAAMCVESGFGGPDAMPGYRSQSEGGSGCGRQPRHHGHAHAGLFLKRVGQTERRTLCGCGPKDSGLPVGTADECRQSDQIFTKRRGRLRKRLGRVCGRRHPGIAAVVIGVFGGCCLFPPPSWES